MAIGILLGINDINENVYVLILYGNKLKYIFNYINICSVNKILCFKLNIYSDYLVWVFPLSAGDLSMIETYDTSNYFNKHLN